MIQIINSDNIPLLAILPKERRDVMNKIEELMVKIDEMRKQMNDLIQEKEDLVDPEVITASQKLDSVLNDYNNILKSKKESKR